MMYSQLPSVLVLSLSLLMLGACATEEAITSSGSTQPSSSSRSCEEPQESDGSSSDLVPDL